MGGRSVKELRVANISTLEDANRYLDDVYLPFWNERFAVEPAESRNAHRRLSKRPDLDALFAETLTRSVGNDFTIQYSSRRWQISKCQARGIRPRHKITVELRIDGSTRFRFKKRYLDLEPVAELPKPRPQNSRPPRTKKTLSTAKTAKSRPTPPKPGPDHPWRKHGRLIANPRAIARHRATTATSRPSASTPSMEGVS